MVSNKNNFLSAFPEPDFLLSQYTASEDPYVPEVNGHVHSPYSFSAFRDIEQAFQLALEQDVSILGINDFYTTKAFQSFHDLAVRYGIFPLFNVEFIGLSAREQKQGIRINDPNNPGRIYLCGKGLKFPVAFHDESQILIEQLIQSNNHHCSLMISKVNNLLRNVNFPGVITLSEIMLKVFVTSGIQTRKMFLYIKECLVIKLTII